MCGVLTSELRLHECQNCGAQEPSRDCQLRDATRQTCLPSAQCAWSDFYKERLIAVRRSENTIGLIDCFISRLRPTNQNLILRLDEILPLPLMTDNGAADHSWPNGLLGKHRAGKLFSVLAFGVAHKGLRERSTH